MIFLIEMKNKPTRLIKSYELLVVDLKRKRKKKSNSKLKCRKEKTKVLISNVKYCA